MTRSLIQFLRLAAIAVLLSACATAPKQETTSEAEIELPDPAAEAVVTADTPRLQEAAALLEQDQLIPAASILSEFEPGKLVPDDQARYGLIAAELRYRQGDAIAALASVEQVLIVAPGMNATLLWELRQWQLRLVGATAGMLASAEVADQLLSVHPNPFEQLELRHWIWRALQRTGTEQLLSNYESTENPQWQAWLALALAASEVMQSPTQQSGAVNAWLDQHPEHPAAQQLPGGLDTLETLAGEAPEKVAILLPLSGPLQSAGAAVLDGFLAAYYDALARGWPPLQIQVIDSTEWSDVNAAYSEATARGAELVIGPLTKERLGQWHGIGAEVPLLALNRFQQPPLNSTNTYQFGLAPEDEARQLAEVAFDQGARRALLINAAGSWGTSMAEALQSRWLELGGEIHARAVYSKREDYSDAIREALRLSDSEERARALRAALGETVEFTPRRRKDIDSVFLLSGKPEEARSLKPLLAFHYAGDLPVYSSSHIFSGRVDPARDRDLNGIRLVEIPWLVDADNPLRDTVRDAGGIQTLAAMYALGADAFLLHWRLPQLAAADDASLRGQTGLLSMDQQGRLRRELTPARMSRGMPLARNSN